MDSGFASVFKVMDIRNKAFALKVFNKWPTGIMSTFEKCAGFEHCNVRDVDVPLTWMGQGVQRASARAKHVGAVDKVIDIDLREQWVLNGRQKKGKEWLQEV